MTKLNPVKIKRWLDEVTGKCKVTLGGDGKLLVHCSITGGGYLVKMSHYDGHDIKVTCHIPKVTNKGIIHGVDDEFSDDDLTEGLTTTAGIKVINAKRLGKSKSVVVTFNGSSLPGHVLYGYVSQVQCQIVYPKPNTMLSMSALWSYCQTM